MSIKILCAAVAATLVLAAGPAQAHGGGHSTIAFTVENLAFGTGSCEGTDFPATFDMESLAGAPLGTGTTCICSIDGCVPFRPFCRQTVEATFTLDFGRGTRAVGASMCVEPTFEPDRVVAALNAAGVEYVIIGGLALGAHGVVRATRDLDIVAAPDQRNMDGLARCLRALGGEHPIQGPLTGSALGRLASFKVRTKHGEVQVVNRMTGVPNFDELRRDEIRVEIAPDAVAPVCSLDHLRATKRAADRPRDRVDLAELDELHGPG